MNTSDTAAQDQNKAENIRRQYMSRSETKMEQLQRLDEKVKLPGKMIACILGIIGSIIMGAGMSLIMVWTNMTSGLEVSIPGIFITLMAYPVFTWITGMRKKKYAQEIIRLSDDIINEKEGN